MRLHYRLIPNNFTPTRVRLVHHLMHFKGVWGTACREGLEEMIWGLLPSTPTFYLFFVLVLHFVDMVTVLSTDLSSAHGQPVC